MLINQLLNELVPRLVPVGVEQARKTRAAWKDISPDFERYVVGFLAGEVWSREHLDLRTKRLVTIATLAAMGGPLALELNIRIALGNGATQQEIVETLLHITPYSGFPAAWEGLALANQVFREVGDAGAGD